ncbi:hypothetical protein F01_520137 [Burkholderia cenocepacia]|nr:hypothetical protein F01_520137 [Burkholderia cenocepacia]
MAVCRRSLPRRAGGPSLAQAIARVWHYRAPFCLRILGSPPDVAQAPPAASAHRLSVRTRIRGDTHAQVSDRHRYSVSRRDGRAAVGGRAGSLRAGRAVHLHVDLRVVRADVRLPVRMLDAVRPPRGRRSVALVVSRSAGRSPRFPANPVLSVLSQRCACQRSSSPR